LLRREKYRRDCSIQKQWTVSRPAGARRSARAGSA